MFLEKFENTFESQCAKRVSYILATKNHADKLDEALSRLRMFKGVEDELLIMDGLSTDHTKEIVRKYADIIDVFVSEPDQPPSYANRGFYGEPIMDPLNAVNKGIILSRGKYIKTIGDDDIYHPEGMEKAVEILEANPGIDLLICGGTRERYGRIEYVYMPPGIGYGKDIKDVFSYGEGCGVGHFFKKSALTKAGLHPYCVVRTGGEVVIVADVEYVLKFFASGCNVKFCRINLFHSPWSHYDYDPGLRIEVSRYWFNAARRYCSTDFYIKYFIKRKIKANFFTKKLKQFRKIIYRRISNPILKKLFRKQPKLNYIWDGGFS